MISILLFVFLVTTLFVKYNLHIRRLEKYVKHLKYRKTLLPFFGDITPLIGKTTTQFFNEVVEFTLPNETPIKQYLGPQLILILDKAEDMKAVLNAQDCLGKPYNYDFFPAPHGLLAERSPIAWKPVRKHLNPLFNLKALKSFIPIFNEKSKIFVNELNNEVGKSQFDILPYANSCTLDTIFVTMMGIEIDPKSSIFINYLKGIEDGLHFVIKRLTTPWAHLDCIYQWTYLCKEGERIYSKIRSVTNMVFKKHTENSANQNKMEQNALIDGNKKSLIMSLYFEGKVDEEGVKQQIENFIIAGYETTAATISYAILLLAMYPEIQEEVFNEMHTVYRDQNEDAAYEHIKDLHLLDRVIKETMRLFPIAPFITRTASSDIPVSNCVIPKNTFIVLSIYTMHRKQNVWGVDADKFNPDNFLPERVQSRDQYAYLPFSGGPRNCIAYKYAMFSLKVILSAVLRNYSFKTNLKMSDLKFRYEVTLKLNNKHMVSVEKRQW